MRMLWSVCLLCTAASVVANDNAVEIFSWSLTPGRVAAGTTTAVTVTGSNFPVGQASVALSVLQAENIRFSDVVVRDSNTLNATLSVPASAPRNTYYLRVDTQPGVAGSAVAATDYAKALTVADSDPAADLVDIGPGLGIPGADGRSAGLLVDDLNQDGLDDVLFITHSPGPEVLLLGTGGALVPQPVMFAADRHECDSADVNGDGLIDLYCSVGSGKGTGAGANNLWLQQKHGGYMDVAPVWGVTDLLGRGREVAFLHANNDAWPDLYVSNWGPRPDGKASVNQLFINDAGKSYRPAPEFGVDGDMPATCAVAVDFNGDGLDDLVVCGRGHLRMFANRSGKRFVEVSAAYGLKRFVVDVDFADIDNDGDLDIAFATPTRFEIHRLRHPTGKTPFNDGVAFSAKVENGRSVAFGDVNGDGLPDAYFVQKGCRTKLEGNLPDVLARNTGESFATMSAPDITRGCGDAVAAFDHDGDGKDGFVVGNGRGRSGPLQYLVLP